MGARGAEGLAGEVLQARRGLQSVRLMDAGMPQLAPTLRSATMHGRVIWAGARRQRPQQPAASVVANLPRNRWAELYSAQVQVQVVCARDESVKNGAR